MMNWRLWTSGAVERQIESFTPLLAQWEKNSSPSQIRLRSYLDSVVANLSPLPGATSLFLHMDVDVGDPKRLLQHYDLENYLTPLFGARWLPAHRFTLVSARKKLGGGSRITCGIARPFISTNEPGWSHLTIDAGRGSELIRKQRIRDALIADCPSPLPPGPAKVRIAWRCGPGRTWTNLWKSTCDAMGPVLGVTDSNKPYHLNDDRIVDLEFHNTIDNNLRHDVIVGLWWRAG